VDKDDNVLKKKWEWLPATTSRHRNYVKGTTIKGAAAATATPFILREMAIERF